MFSTFKILLHAEDFDLLDVINYKFFFYIEYILFKTHYNLTKISFQMSSLWLDQALMDSVWNDLHC